jgi:hypothetical protein
MPVTVTACPFYGVSFRETFAELELKDAVILAVWVCVTAKEKAGKTAISTPSGIVAIGGIHRNDVFVESVTVIPPAAATGAVIFTVHQVSESDCKLNWLQ